MSSTVSVAVMDRLTIDPHAPEPSYRQLADQLRARIQSGQIGPREALPSISYMVQETGLAIGTVRRAIEVLVDEHLAYTVPGRGTFAAEAPPVAGPELRSAVPARPCSGLLVPARICPRLPA